MPGSCSARGAVPATQRVAHASMVSTTARPPGKSERARHHAMCAATSSPSLPTSALRARRCSRPRVVGESVTRVAGDGALTVTPREPSRSRAAGPLAVAGPSPLVAAVTVTVLPSLVARTATGCADVVMGARRSRGLTEPVTWACNRWPRSNHSTVTTAPHRSALRPASRRASLPQLQPQTSRRSCLLPQQRQPRRVRYPCLPAAEKRSQSEVHSDRPRRISLCRRAGQALVGLLFPPYGWAPTVGAHPPLTQPLQVECAPWTPMLGCPTVGLWK